MSNHSINISTVQNIHFIGIGGIGMSALARFFLVYGQCQQEDNGVCCFLTV
ncbi:MAG: Mur ligase domain-containing protein [Patescibacteria group bacterium]